MMEIELSMACHPELRLSCAHEIKKMKAMKTNLLLGNDMINALTGNVAGFKQQALADTCAQANGGNACIVRFHCLVDDGRARNNIATLVGFQLRRDSEGEST